MANTNCLKGIRCPKCLQEDQFQVEGTCMFDVTDQGSEANGDHEWDGTSVTTCVECGHTANMSDFEIENQEPLSRCQNCEWLGIPVIGLEAIPDLTQRISPGEAVPSGECPECGALCHEATAEEIAAEEESEDGE